MDRSKDTASGPHRSNRDRDFPHPRVLRPSKVPRGRGRPPRSRKEWEEYLFHRYTLLFPAAGSMHKAARLGTVDGLANALPRLLHGGTRWLWPVGFGRLARLFYYGTPREIAVHTLALQHGRSIETVLTYVQTSSSRHRRGVCLLYSEGCWGLGGLRACPRSIADPRYRTVRDAFPSRPGGLPSPGRPRMPSLLTL